ncbi:MAG: helix-turn-helix transcriptional regulator [Synergistaceae bacterium]|jgi:predicted transcriptional regulator YheO|nr:helix-turn-helix transcriptional regulator [Synergistaceae bacterium]
MENNARDEFLDFLEKLASLIAETFGSNCEVVISDLDHPEAAVLTIFNGHVTGRKVGDPLIPQALERVLNSADGYYINRDEGGGKRNKLLKASTISARIGGRNIAFCINYDYTHLETLKHSLDEFLSMQNEKDMDEDFPYSQHIEQTVKEAIKLVHKPVRLMNKKERLEVISYLEKRGILKIQKSVQTIARYLGISRYTVYNYLNELRTERDEKQA